MLRSEVRSDVTTAMHSLQHGNSIESIATKYRNFFPIEKIGHADGSSSRSGPSVDTEIDVALDNISRDEDTLGGTLGGDGRTSGHTRTDSSSPEYTAQSSNTSVSPSLGFPSSLRSENSAQHIQTPQPIQSPQHLQSPDILMPVSNLGQHSLSHKMFDFAFVTQHLRLLFDWELSPLTMIHKERFEDDFLNGRTANCSPALVAAVISVSSRLWGPDQQESDGDDSGGCWGNVFAHESDRLLRGQTSAENAKVPTIQALGLLSLRAVREGNEAEARAFSNRGMAALVSRMLPELRGEENEKCSAPEDQDGTAGKMFCGVITVARYARSQNASRRRHV